MPTDATTEQLRMALEKVLLDIKFMSEDGLIPARIFGDIIYQNALELMTPEFMKEFNNEK